MTTSLSLTTSINNKRIFEYIYYKLSPSTSDGNEIDFFSLPVKSSIKAEGSWTLTRLIKKICKHSYNENTNNDSIEIQPQFPIRIQDLIDENFKRIRLNKEKVRQQLIIKQEENNLSADLTSNSINNKNDLFSPIISEEKQFGFHDQASLSENVENHNKLSENDNSIINANDSSDINNTGIDINPIWSLPSGFLPYLLISSSGTLTKIRLFNGGNAKINVLDPTLASLYEQYGFGTIHNNKRITLHAWGFW